MRSYLVIAIILAGVIGSNPASAETVIGRWCDKQIPTMPQYNNVMTIYVSGLGRVMMRSNYNDGSSSVHELREMGGGVYAHIDSRSGDKYRIVGSSGELQLLDNDGIIRTASRLENTPQRGECR